MRTANHWVLVGVLAVAVIVVAVVFALPGGLALPPTGQPPGETQPQALPSPPAPSPRDSSSATPALPAPAPSAALPEWPVTPMPNPAPDAYRGGIPDDLAPGGPGFVAVGSVAPCCAHPAPANALWQSVVWTSQDGIAWDLVPDLDTFGRSGLAAVANDGEGTLVALGHNVPPPAEAGAPDSLPPARSGTVWQSVNGIDWVAVQGVEGNFRDVVWTGTDWVIVGELDGRATAFESADLATWSIVILGGQGSSANLLTVRDDGPMLAVGCVADVDAPRCRSGTWVSDDGSAWEQRELEASRLSAAAAWSGGFVVAGAGVDDARGRTWVSVDGLEWVAGAALSEMNAQITTIAAWDGGLIAGGGAAPMQMNLPALWQSVDGLSWEPLALPARLEGQVDGQVRALLPVGARLIALGEAFVNVSGVGGGAGPYVWIGEP